MSNQDLVYFVSYCSFLSLSFTYQVYVVFCLIVFGCQYQCNRLPGKTHLQNDLLCVEWDVKPHTLTHLSLLLLVIEVTEKETKTEN